MDLQNLIALALMAMSNNPMPAPAAAPVEQGLADSFMHQLAAVGCTSTSNLADKDGIVQSNISCQKLGFVATAKTTNKGGMYITRTQILRQDGKVISNVGGMSSSPDAPEKFAKVLSQAGQPLPTPSSSTREIASSMVAGFKQIGCMPAAGEGLKEAGGHLQFSCSVPGMSLESDTFSVADSTLSTISLRASGMAVSMLVASSPSEHQIDFSNSPLALK